MEIKKHSHSKENKYLIFGKIIKKIFILRKKNEFKEELIEFDIDDLILEEEIFNEKENKKKI